MAGVELDPTSALIASYLHPEACIRRESFVDTNVPSFPKLLAPVGFPIGATKDGEVVFVTKPRVTVQG